MITMDLLELEVDEKDHMDDILEPFLVHIYHTNGEILSQVFTFVATKNLLISIPWFC